MGHFSSEMKELYFTRTSSASMARGDEEEKDSHTQTDNNPITVNKHNNLQKKNTK